MGRREKGRRERGGEGRGGGTLDVFGTDVEPFLFVWDLENLSIFVIFIEMKHFNLFTSFMNSCCLLQMFQFFIGLIERVDSVYVCYCVVTVYYFHMESTQNTHVHIIYDFFFGLADFFGWLRGGILWFFVIYCWNEPFSCGTTKHTCSHHLWILKVFSFFFGFIDFLFDWEGECCAFL